MLFVAFWEVQRLTREIHDLEKQEMDKRVELSHYANYSGRLGGSSIMNISNIAGLSPKLLPRAMTFAQYSDQASSMSAMQNLQMMKMTGRVPFTGNQMQQYQIEMSAFRQFKEEALKALKQQEVDFLHEKEEEIKLELNAISTRKKAAEGMLAEAKKQIDESFNK